MYEQTMAKGEKLAKLLGIRSLSFATQVRNRFSPA
jgi:hypothetical protein